MKILKTLYNTSRPRWERAARRTRACASVGVANPVMMAISKELNLSKSRGSNSTAKEGGTPKKESDCKRSINSDGGAGEEPSADEEDPGEGHRVGETREQNEGLDG